MLKILHKDYKDKVKRLLSVMLPIIGTQIAIMGMNFFDASMSGQAGDADLAGAAIGGNIWMPVQTCFAGILLAAMPLIANLLGAGEKEKISTVVRHGMLLAVAFSVLIIVGGVIFLPPFLQGMGLAPKVYHIALWYMAGLGIGVLPFFLITPLRSLVDTLGYTKLSMKIYLLALPVNAFLNYVLIFGKLGMPAMGVSGAAVATLIARIIEIVLILGYVYGKRLPVACGLKDLFGWSRLFVSRFFGTSAPVIANEFMWGLGTTMYSLAYGRMGDEAVAAITIATTIQDILVVLFQGLSAATAVILGNELGAGHLKRAEKYAVHFFILQFIATVGVAVVLIGIRWPIIGLYNITPEVARDVSLCILIFAAYMPAKMFNYVNVVGVLRSGGDTKMCLFLDTSGVWFIGVPLAFLGALVWRLPIYTVYALVMTEEVYKAVLGYIRYRQKKWLRNLASDVG